MPTRADVDGDVKAEKLRSELAEVRRKYRAALQVIDEHRAAAKALEALKGLRGQPLPRRKKRSKRRSQATAVVCYSDWHVEERVRPEEVRGLNDYTLAEADRRISEVVARTMMLLEHESALTDFRRVVLWLGGDLITGHIHDELVESSQLPPLEATRWVGERVASAIDQMASLGMPLVVVTSPGNHGRSTPNRRIAGENDHSYEQHLYRTLASQEKRRNVTWIVGGGYHNIVDLDGFRVRFHHGHAMRGSGGFGGLVPGANKLIAGWDASQPVDLDVFGHLHSFTVSRKFIANGSLIGPSPYSDRLGCPAEPPAQAMFVVDHGHNRVTRALPIFVD